MQVSLLNFPLNLSDTVHDYKVSKSRETSEKCQHFIIVIWCSSGVNVLSYFTPLPISSYASNVNRSANQLQAKYALWSLDAEHPEGDHVWLHQLRAGFLSKQPWGRHVWPPISWALWSSEYIESTYMWVSGLYEMRLSWALTYTSCLPWYGSSSVLYCTETALSV